LSFGGATHGDALSSAVVRLASLPLLGAAVWRLAKVRQPPRVQAAILLLCAIIAVPLIQLIPLPPQLWSLLPGHWFLIADYRAAGIAPPWLPVSLAPYETADALPWLAPPSAMFLATLSLASAERRRMVLAVPLFALLAVALGIAQVAGGDESPLRFYAVTNVHFAVGFFANKNHQASLLLVAAALAPLWVTAFRNVDRQRGRFGLFLAIAIELVLIVGIGVSGSRAGVLLAIPAILGGALIVLVQGGGKAFRRSAAAMLVAGAVGTGLVGVFASTTYIVERFQSPLRAELRVQVMPAIEHSAEAFLPVGSGLGSFDRIYPMFEPIGAVSDGYLNHAHNDFLELWLETGAFGLILIGTFLLWWFWTTLRLWRRRRQPPQDGVRPAASLVIGLLLAHSLVDYPLRTAALATLFALACGILAAPADSASGPLAARGRRPENADGISTAAFETDSTLTAASATPV
jgi:O-antigen ligase